jgi:hypothetical protein
MKCKTLECVSVPVSAPRVSVVKDLEHILEVLSGVR